MLVTILNYHSFLNFVTKNITLYEFLDFAHVQELILHIFEIWWDCFFRLRIILSIITIGAGHFIYHFSKPLIVMTIAMMPWERKKDKTKANAAGPMLNWMEANCHPVNFMLDMPWSPGK